MTEKKKEVTKTLTTAFGIPVSDDQNSQTAGERGPVLMQDVHLLEKLAHFDRERIPERVVHAKGAEEEFVADGFGLERFDLMYNDFIIIGPPSDPAAIRGTASVIDALKKIAAARARFASRGDDSGTHKKELALWSETGVDVNSASGTWYREMGGGMGATLNVGIGMNAYVMTDRATWISFANRRGFEILLQGDHRLFNQYGVILVDPERHAHVKAALAQSFIDWLLGETGQQAIAAFRVDGKQLFYPNARPSVGDQPTSLFTRVLVAASHK